ncbi:MAG: hypothetical protein LKM38_27090 [Pseudomonas veronii]|nr:hypothetical protein [Pseudomonas veronii]
METSFANAGQISPGYASPWAAPDVPLKAHQVAVATPRAAGDHGHSLDINHVPVDGADAAQLHRLAAMR